MDTQPNRRIALPIIIPALVAIVCVSSKANQNPKSERLVTLRFEVDEKSRLFEHMQAKLDIETSGLETQIANTKMLLAAERTRKKTLLKMQRQQQEKTKAVRQTNIRFKEPALQVAKLIIKHVECSIPFKNKGRITQVETVIDDLNSNNMDATTALSRLWRSVEDEIKLTRETGLYQQVISLNNEPVLADVVRVGMSVMYFKTDDERFGIARHKAPDSYVFEEVSQPIQVDPLRILFDSLKKQIRTGNFKLLLPTPTKYEKRDK